MQLRTLLKQITEAGSQKNFMHWIEGIVELVSKAMSLLMILVIVVAVVDLTRLLLVDVLFEPVVFFKKTLFEIFGLFLTVLIALELLENITGYLQKHVIQVELVIVTSLIAIARKIIILDLEKVSGTELIGLAVTIFALSISYGIIRISTQKNHH